MSFHSLVRSERPLVLPGAFDALSARLIKRAGFKAYFTGGFPMIGARWGLPDIGLVALGEISSAVTDIMAASDLPVMVDGAHEVEESQLDVRQVQVIESLVGKRFVLTNEIVAYIAHRPSDERRKIFRRGQCRVRQQ